MPEQRSAVFLDRDGTLIEDRHYLADAGGVALVPGAAAAVRRINDAALAAVVVTNQSGIAQGLLTEAQYQATRDRLADLMRAAGARIDAQYHCPHHPDVSGPCACRKPGVELYERAARDLGLSLTTSLFVGDRWRDVAPGVAVGGRGILVPSPATPPEELLQARAQVEVAASLDAALDRFLAVGPSHRRRGLP